MIDLWHNSAQAFTKVGTVVCYSEAAQEKTRLW